MNYLLDRLSFISELSIDKIVMSGSITIYNDGNTTATGNNKGFEFSRIIEQTVPNRYGRAGLIRGRWSIDGGNTWNSLDAVGYYSYTVTVTDYGYTSDPMPGIDAAISIGCNNDNIIFRTANGRHGNVSMTSTSPPTSGYTPSGKTFIIQYWMFERE